MYNFDNLSNKIDLLREQIHAAYGDRISYQKVLFDTLNQLGSCYLHIRSMFGNKKDKNEIIYSTVYKGLFNIHSIITLNSQGNVGASRYIMRNTFEWMTIGKFLHHYPNEEIFQRWCKSEVINLDREIFNRHINNRDTLNEYVSFWSDLSKFTHATSSSGQISYEIEDIYDDIELNFIFTDLLLTMMYYFIRKIVRSESVINYTRNYSYLGGVHDEIVDYEATAMQIIRNNVQPHVSDRGRKIIKHFRSSWVLDISSNLQSNIDNVNETSEYSERTKGISYHLFTNKNEIIEYINLYIELMNQTEEYGKGYRINLCKYLKKINQLIKKSNLPNYSEKSMYYQVLVYDDRIDVDLVRSPCGRDSGEEYEVYPVLTVMTCISEYVDIDRFAAIHGITTDTVKRWIRESKLRYAKSADKHWFIPEIHQRPEHYLGSVNYKYFPEELSEEVRRTYPFLEENNYCYIMNADDTEHNYCIAVKKSYYSITSKYLISDNERIEIERELLSSSNVSVEHFRIRFEPDITS